MEVKKFRKEVVTEGYSLELSDKEAFFLIDLLKNVGGSPACSIRRYADSVYGRLIQDPILHDHDLNFNLVIFKKAEIECAPDRDYK